MSGPMVLIVEDEAKIAGVLADYLRAAGYSPEILSRGDEVEGFVRAREPALVLLDLMLPGLGGLDVCRALRAFSDVPIIMVTARVEEVDRLLGLDVGADDYVSKPFSPREVVARVKAVLRRPRVIGGPLLAVGPFEADEEKMRVLFRGERVALTTSEFRLLAKLLKQPGRIFSRAQLLLELRGGDDEAFDRAIDTHIKNIRKKLAKIDPDANPIRSVYGAGYAFELE